MSGYHKDEGYHPTREQAVAEGDWVARQLAKLTVTTNLFEGDHMITFEGEQLTAEDIALVRRHQAALGALLEHFDADIIVRPKGKAT